MHFQAMLRASDLKVGEGIIYQGGNEYLSRYLLHGQVLWVKHFSSPETVVVRNLVRTTFALSTGNKLNHFKKVDRGTD